MKLLLSLLLLPFLFVQSDFAFTLEEIKRLKCCLPKAVKVAVAINNPIENHSKDVVLKTIPELDNSFVDAVIVSDLGLLVHLQGINIPIHLSSLCEIINSEAVLYSSLIIGLIGFTASLFFILKKEK